MGRDKALLPWPPGNTAGTTFLSAAIESLASNTDMVVVVAGVNAAALESTVYAHGASLVVNPQPERGQFSSLRIGLREVLNRGRDTAVLTPVDRPPAREETVAMLRESYVQAAEQGYWAAIPSNAGRHGHPMIAGRDLIEALLRAPEESNAREVLNQNASRLYYVEVDDDAAFENINTPEEYERLNAAKNTI